jgi:hypothetical protein
MNWEEKINIRFSIETGDGKVFYPLYKGGEKEREFNTSSFEFINVYGTLVDRKRPAGAKFPLVFYFEGANNIDKADEFESSCEDPRQWIVNHPFYGEIKGQPMSIKRDDSYLNITEITVPFWESISPDYPFSNFSTKDNTREQHRTTMYAFSLSADNKELYRPIDKTKQTEILGVMGSELKAVQDNNTYADFQNAFNEGLKAIDNLLEQPLSAIQSVQNFLDLPSTYERAIQGRVASYESIYWRLKQSIKTVADKKYFESMAGTILSLISVTAVTPFGGDYLLVSDVEKMVEKINNLYSDYKKTLDDLSVSVYNVKNTFIPDANAQKELNLLVNYVLSNLYVLSFGSKKERIIVVPKNTNVILLVHRYMGLDADDANIETFIKMNEISFNELFQIKKGREIKFVK